MQPQGHLTRFATAINLRQIQERRGFVKLLDPGPLELQAMLVGASKVHASPIDGAVKLVPVDINVEAFGLLGQLGVATVVISK